MKAPLLSFLEFQKEKKRKVTSQKEEMLLPV